MARSLTIAEFLAQIPALRAGDDLLLSGTLFTARDAAHKRLAQLINDKQPLPLPLVNAVIYYCGPAPARPGDAVGPCGPTTSTRMDPYTPLLLSQGVRATIGKGKRSASVTDACRTHQAVYCVMTGGVAALLSRKVKRSEIVAFADLGPEAIWRLDVVDFPVTVALDSQGNSVFDLASKQ
ncbi:MAG TPA: FumA C-terminus/TtdB family hydratase beta subunit [Polyangia bacterium]|jgi:hydro-lyases, Fe-S type, tartrate/fumarate subfamily, beta region|nr:FumA C-terminus/TtdB family hydratase beta subunit [Polyangia bacterium]